jgi:hypothetical protein
VIQKGLSFLSIKNPKIWVIKNDPYLKQNALKIMVILKGPSKLSKNWGINIDDAVLKIGCYKRVP